MLRDDKAWLTDIALACRKVLRYTQSVPYDEFLRDERTQDAVLRCLEVIGEAAGNVSEETQLEQSEIPWSQIIAFRNRLIHGYFEIDFQRVWDVVQEEVGVLLQLIEATIDLPPENDGDEVPAPR